MRKMNFFIKFENITLGSAYFKAEIAFSIELAYFSSSNSEGVKFPKKSRDDKTL